MNKESRTASLLILKTRLKLLLKSQNAIKIIFKKVIERFQQPIETTSSGQIKGKVTCRTATTFANHGWKKILSIFFFTIAWVCFNGNPEFLEWSYFFNKPLDETLKILVLMMVWCSKQVFPNKPIIIDDPHFFTLRPIAKIFD